MSLILWSGGCDSSLLLFQLATEALAAGKAMPRALSINYDSQLTAGEQQRKVRAAFLKELARRGMKIDATELSISRNGKLWAHQDKTAGLIQPSFWLGIGQMFLLTEEDLYLAYVRGDDIWHYREHLIAVFNANQAIMKKLGGLYLPFEWVPKDDILKDLKAAGLDKLVWYCECVKPGDTKPCGWCPSCKSMAAGRYLAKRKWGYDQPPTSETKDEPKQPDPRQRRKTQRSKALSRDRRARPTAANSARKAARSRRVR